MAVRHRGRWLFASALIAGLSASCNALLGIDSGALVEPAEAGTDGAVRFAVTAVRKEIRLPLGGEVRVAFTIEGGDATTRVQSATLPRGVTKRSESLAPDGRTFIVVLQAADDAVRTLDEGADMTLEIASRDGRVSEKPSFKLRIGARGSIDQSYSKVSILASGSGNHRLVASGVGAYAVLQPDGASEIFVVRIGDNGAIDEGYGQQGIAKLGAEHASCDLIRAVVVDDNIQVVGQCSGAADEPLGTWMWQVPPDGKVVQTLFSHFHPDEFVVGNGRFDDGGIWVAQHFPEGRTAFRFATDVSLRVYDETFRTMGQDDGGYLFFSVDNNRGTLRRLAADLELDRTYGVDGLAILDAGQPDLDADADVEIDKPKGQVTARLQSTPSSASLLVFESADAAQPEPPWIAKVKPNGYIDTDFPYGTKLTRAAAGGAQGTAIHLDPRSRIFVGRRPDEAVIEGRNVLGLLDPTFAEGGRRGLGVKCDVAAIEADSDGLLLVLCVRKAGADQGEVRVLRVWP